MHTSIPYAKHVLDPSVFFPKTTYTFCSISIACKNIMRLTFKLNEYNYCKYHKYTANSKKVLKNPKLKL